MPVTVYEALDLIDLNTYKVSTEIIPIENSINRVSATSLKAIKSLPIFDNSAMDGYGLKGKEKNYKIIGKILAGDSFDKELKDGECVKILTGAKVPKSVETVIPQENITKKDDNTIKIEKDVKYGSNIRYIGEDIKKGEPILNDGESINSSHVGLLASQGITHIKVYRKVKIGVFASGSELKLHFQRLNDSQIFNSNTPYLISRSQELNADVRFIGKSDDNIDSLKDLINSALDCDLILTSGGASVGEADFTQEAFAQLGMKKFFSKIKIKPGKPTKFGVIGKTLVLNLPGNPLASALNFEMFGKFIILKLSGRKDYYHDKIEAILKDDISSKQGVIEIIPGIFDGKYFKPLKKFAPGMVNVLNHCNGFIATKVDKDHLKKEENIKFLPIRWDFCIDRFEDFTS